jgi:glycosyltransferase involved in cell wall biosynthesis
LVRLVRHFRRERYDVVHSTTPKAGLLAMAAALIAHIPVRIHTFTGQVWQTRSGAMRWLLKATDGLTSSCATTVLVDGTNQLNFLLSHGVVSPSKARVLGNGSICGVDIDRFRPCDTFKGDVRSEFDIPEDDVVLVYMARLTVDKGALVMAKAFRILCSSGAGNFHLLMIGPDEENLTQEIESTVGEHRARLHMMGYTREPEKYIAAADVFCLPSYREGFPMVLLNAAACAVPAIASRIHGSTDAIVDTVTGLLHEAGDHEALVAHVLALANDVQLRRRLGDAARRRVVDLYSETVVTRELAGLYENLTTTSSKASHHYQ